MKAASSRRTPKFATLRGICLATAIGYGATVAATPEFFVDPTGNNTNSGTSVTAPFQTLERARQAVAAVKGSMTGDITVYLRGGTHRLPSPLTLTASDSGTNGYYVVYRNYSNEVPVISGGTNLSGGWLLLDPARNLYGKSNVTARFRQVYVNGKAGIRAREPNRTNDDNLGPFRIMAGVNCAGQQANIPQSEIANWAGLSNVEMVMNPHWYHYRGRIASYTTSGGRARVTFRSPECNSIFAKGDAFWDSTPYYLENSIDFLDADGEWFLDADTSVLYYIPRAGEDMATALVEAPVLDKLVDLAGTSSSAKVRNIRLAGLTFAHSGWYGPSTNGVAMTQGAMDLVARPYMAALTVRYADSLDVTNCSLGSIGWNAISLVKGVTGSIIQNCTLRGISGNGIVVGDQGGMNPAEGDICQDIKIINNAISRVGQQYDNAIGILSYYVKRIVVAQNDICFCPYMGTQTGGQTGANTEAGMKDNILRNNYVHHVMQLHDDGGAFYTLGRQQGTLIADNYALSLWASYFTGSYPVAGLDADNYSEFITFNRNATVSCSASVNENTGTGARNNIWTNNVTTASANVTTYAGRKADGILPVKLETSSLILSNFTSDARTAYSDNTGAICDAGTGTASTVFSGLSGVYYKIHVAYLAQTNAAASYLILTNGVQVDAWTAPILPSSSDNLQIQHRVASGIPIGSNVTITVIGAAAAGAPARLDYVEIFPRQVQAPPVVPANLQVEAVSDTAIALSWEPSTGASSYTLQRATSPGGPYTTLATGLSSPTYLDTGLDNGLTYYYTVTAGNTGGTSLSSGTASVAPLPKAVTVQLEAESDTYIDRGSQASNYGTATTLNAKNADTTTIQRKIYLRFSLAGQTFATRSRATLRLVATTWNQSSTWQVYGLKDGDAGETWSETGITWTSAPANNTSSGDLVDANRTVALGSFSVNGAPAAGTVVEFSSPALDAFLQADTNHSVTLILTRSTISDAANSSIAARENGSYAGPTLVFYPAPVSIDATRLNGSSLELNVSGLTPARSYRLKRSANLTDGFPVLVNASITNVTNALLYDPDPPRTSAFYRVETVP